MVRKTPISIIHQPENCEITGTEVGEFFVTAIGDELVYLWKYKLSENDEWISTNCTDNMYSVSVDQGAVDGMLVMCLITDKYGEVQETNTVVLSIASVKTEISMQPESVTILDTETATFSVSVIGEGLSYLWMIKGVNDTAWIETSCTDSIFNISMENGAEDGMLVVCQITDKNNEMIRTEEVLLTVLLSKPVITVAKVESVGNGKVSITTETNIPECEYTIYSIVDNEEVVISTTN